MIVYADNQIDNQKRPLKTGKLYQLTDDKRVYFFRQYDFKPYHYIDRSKNPFIEVKGPFKFIVLEYSRFDFMVYKIAITDRIGYIGFNLKEIQEDIEIIK